MFLNFGDIRSNTEERKRKNFCAIIKLKLSCSISYPKDTIEEQEKYADDKKGGEPTIYEDDNIEWYDEYNSSKVLLTLDGKHTLSAKFISSAKDYKVNVIFVRNSNPILDTCV